MITAISWIPKGVSKSLPTVVEPPSKKEIEEILRSGAFGRSEGSESEDDVEDMDGNAVKQEDGFVRALAAVDALGKSSKTSDLEMNFQDITSALQELDMEHYDDEDAGMELFGTGLENIYYTSNELDPYLQDNDDDDSEELEDMTIKADDSVIVYARNEGLSNFLKVLVYEDPAADGDPNMYPHHETPIPAFPLCIAWLDCPIKGGEKGNFLAVGTMNESIEIWDLDIINEVQPLLVLGGIAREGSHTDSVLGLAWNKEYRNILASSSADKLVKIWDVTTEKCDITMAHHTDKVQTVSWNHHVPQGLLSGSFDRTVVMRDGRMPSHTGFKWSVSADVESAAWDPHNENSFVVSLQNGFVDGFDIRATASSQSSESKPIFTLHAHDKEVCAISYNTMAPNLLATGSADRMVKLWDLSNNQPSCIASKNPKAGAVFSISFSEDDPFLLAIGGTKEDLKVWNTLSDAKVSKKYGRCSNGNSS